MRSLSPPFPPSLPLALALTNAHHCAPPATDRIAPSRHLARLAPGCWSQACALGAVLVSAICWAARRCAGLAICGVLRGSVGAYAHLLSAGHPSRRLPPLINPPPTLPLALGTCLPPPVLAPVPLWLRLPPCACAYPHVHTCARPWLGCRYTDSRAANAYVAEGTLRIRAVREECEGCGFTSARLRTKGRGDWTYGRCAWLLCALLCMRVWLAPRPPLHPSRPS
jgi:hypothetical protein